MSDSARQTVSLCQHAFLTIECTTSRDGLIVGDLRDQVGRPPLIRNSGTHCTTYKSDREYRRTLSRSGR